MAKFKQFLEEIAKEQLISNTDEARIQRAIKQLRLNPPKVFEVDEDTERLEYNFKFKPSTEFKRHWGFVEYNTNTEDITRVWCDCKDWFYRLWAPYVQAGLSSWEDNLPKRFQKRPVKSHNHEWTKETNPNGSLFVCKHLIALLRGYF